MTDGTNTWNFTYNADGLRIKRTNGSTTYSYIYNGDKLSQMTVDSDALYFAYDAAGTPMAVTYNGTTYYYVTNVQGDVLQILDANGAAVTEYSYDAWGNILTTTGSMASTLGATNPLRYRGYVYDQETGLYYLQSRYYNPTTGRFINADAYAATGQGMLGNNMFAYCNNSPIEHCDSTGTRMVPATPHPGRSKKSIKYDVPVFNQGKLKLCWAFSQVMLEAFFNKDDLSQDEATVRAKEIAKEKNGFLFWNRGNWPTNLGKEYKYHNIHDIYDIYDILDEHGPVYAYYKNATGEYAHMVVVTGVDCNSDIIYTNNPWNSTPSQQTFNEFISGVGYKKRSMYGMVLISIYATE